MLHYETIPVTPFEQNCSLVWCDESQEAAVIDPGGDLDIILQRVAELKVQLKQIWVTHAHIDHAGGVDELSTHLSLPVIGPHREDQFWIDQLSTQGARYGFTGARAFTPTQWLDDMDHVHLGEHELLVRHCPGHTPGHVVFYSKELNRAFVGDVLFAGSIGRTDFPRGHHETLIQSITERLWPMGNEVVFIPGHGPESTFGRERKTNPYVGGT
jgi:glyoxylase-like metal-dependent hydrolase (beta-lactamase superfamily II)